MEKLYINTNTGEIITYEQFRQLAYDYIINTDWTDRDIPDVQEVMLNMDDIELYEED